MDKQSIMTNPSDETIAKVRSAVDAPHIADEVVYDFGMQKKVPNKNLVRSSTYNICLIAILVAIITGAKTALAFVPNIEIVTLLFVVYTIKFGLRRTLTVSVIFVVVEILIWGFMPWWVVLYFVYWPLLVVVVWLVSLVGRGHIGKVRGRAAVVLAIVAAVAMTVFFGILSTFIEVAFWGFLGDGEFWMWFGIRYASGTIFFVLHIISNAVILPILVPVLYRVRLSRREV